MFESIKVKRFIQRFGPAFSISYFASFAGLVFAARRGWIKGSLPGDILIKFDGEVVTYFPFISSIVVMMAMFLVSRLVTSSKFSRYFLSKLP